MLPLCEDERGNACDCTLLLRNRQRATDVMGYGVFSKVSTSDRMPHVARTLPDKRSALQSYISSGLWRSRHNLHQFDRIAIRIADPVLQIVIQPLNRGSTHLKASYCQLAQSSGQVINQQAYMFVARERIPRRKCSWSILWIRKQFNKRGRS